MISTHHLLLGVYAISIPPCFSDFFSALVSRDALVTVKSGYHFDDIYTRGVISPALNFLQGVGVLTILTNN